jgi:PhnB protein
MRLSTHLSFDGQCEEAFKLYEKCLDGKIEMIMTYQNSPMANEVPAEMRDKVLHASLIIDGQVLMGADAPPGKFSKPHGFAVAVNVSEPDRAERIFKTLSDKGNVQMPLQKTFWAEKFGMLIDRYGTPWMINCVPGN